jgi:hypothetical protein
MQELKMEVTISLRQNDKNIKQDKEKRIYRYIPLDKSTDTPTQGW